MSQEIANQTGSLKALAYEKDQKIKQFENDLQFIKSTME